MTNSFSGLISKDLKELFNNAIDSLLETNSLALPCTIIYDNQINNSYCNNCIFDNISLLSSNIYNGTGPSPFEDGGVCPVCLGLGISQNGNSQETIHLAFIFDSKYFYNINTKVVNIPNGSIQSLCSINLINKIKNSKEIIFDNNLKDLAHFKYERASDPEPLGFGDNNYIITLWKKK